MKETHDIIEEVFTQIENPEDEEDSLLSTQQVMDILLGRKKSRTDLSGAKTVLRNPADQVGPLAQLDFYMPLPEGKSLKWKISNLIKRLIRKMIRPIVLPIVDAQSRFNQASVQAMNDLYQDLEGVIGDLYSNQEARDAIFRYIEQKRDGEENA